MGHYLAFYWFLWFEQILRIDTLDKIPDSNVLILETNAIRLLPLCNLPLGGVIPTAFLLIIFFNGY